MNNMANIFNALQGALQNPMAILSQMGLSQSALQNPQQAVQQLMNSGRMSQDQFNSLRQTAMQIQQAPQFQQMFQNQFNMK